MYWEVLLHSRRNSMCLEMAAVYVSLYFKVSMPPNLWCTSTKRHTQTHKTSTLHQEKHSLCIKNSRILIFLWSKGSTVPCSLSRRVWIRADRSYTAPACTSMARKTSLAWRERSESCRRMLLSPWLLTSSKEANKTVRRNLWEPSEPRLPSTGFNLHTSRGSTVLS